MESPRSGSSCESQLGVFAKYWQPSKAKTRLAASVGDDAAAQLQRAFVVTIVRRFCHLARRRLVAFTPANRHSEFHDIAGAHWQLEAQSEGDLGQRMTHHFARAAEHGCRRVVLIGSDSPNLPVQYVARAFEVLSDCDVVLGPSEDGGYYLVGARPQVDVAAIFADVHWSSPHVWKQTVDNLQRASLSWGQLPAWFDVDEADDLRRLQTHLRETDDEHLLWLREQIQRVLASIPKSL